MTILAIDQLQSNAIAVPPSITRVLANKAMAIEGMIPLWFGEPNQPTPQFICDAAAKSMKAGETFYAEGLGRPFLREAIAKYSSNLYSQSIESQRIAVTVSGGNALNLAFQALLQPNDKVATITPAFPNLLRIPQLQSAQLITHPLEIVDGQWTLNIDAFLETIADAKVVLINSPSNPTGWTMSREQQRQVLAALRSRGIWLIADEVYSRTTFNNEVAPSFLEISEPEDKLIVVNSFSKSWAMTGWRLGWLTLPPSLVPTVEKIAEFSIACAPPFTQRAGVVAIEQGEEFIKQSSDDYRIAKEKVEATLARYPNVQCPKIEATFYAFFRLPEVKDSIAFAQLLIDEAKVGLAPGEAFCAPNNGWFRLCFAQTPEVLDQALARLDHYLQDPARFNC
ncbi:MAG: aspartate/methionine/tyrosine aminotransferase [Oceanospirillaceae bacterium]|jgi:aspartate/methionine/tyrosine aminotransferase